MKTVPQRVYEKNMITLRHWMKKLGVKSFAELIDRWTEAVDLGCKEMFYNKLSPIIIKQPKPLTGKRLQKKYTR